MRFNKVSRARVAIDKTWQVSGQVFDRIVIVFILFYSLLQIYEHTLKVMNNIKSVCLMQVKYTIR